MGGGGHRKRYNRKSYRSKRTTLIRIKQRGGGSAKYIFTTTQWHKYNLLKILNDNNHMFTMTQNYTVDNLTYQIKNKSMTKDRIGALLTFLKEQYKPNNPSIDYEEDFDKTKRMLYHNFYVSGIDLNTDIRFIDTSFRDLSILVTHDRKISYTFRINTGEETEFINYLRKNNITFTLQDDN
jgi:hypothetical protein